MDLIQRTIDLANANVERGGRPFACIVAKGGEIIAEAVNRARPDHAAAGASGCLSGCVLANASSCMQVAKMRAAVG